MGSAALDDGGASLLVREGRLVHALADERVVHVGHRHQPRRDGNRIARQPQRVTAAVPLLLVAVGDFLGHAQERHPHAQPPLGVLDGVAAERGVGLHDLELLGGELARLEEDAVGNADLADVVQRRGFVEQVDHALVEHRLKARMARQPLGQGLDVELRAPDVVAGFVVPRFRERGHGHDGHVLDGLHFQRPQGHLALEVGALVAQEIRRGLQREVGVHPRQQDGRTDRLGDVVHRAHRQAAPLVLRRAARGQEDDGNVARGGMRLELPADLVAVQAGHHDVKQDQVGRRVGLGDAQRLLAVVGHLDEVMVAQQRGHEREVVGGVVHHQHRGDGPVLEHGVIGEQGSVHGGAEPVSFGWPAARRSARLTRRRKRWKAPAARR